MEVYVFWMEGDEDVSSDWKAFIFEDFGNW